MCRGSPSGGCGKHIYSEKRWFIVAESESLLGQRARVGGGSVARRTLPDAGQQTAGS